MTGAPGTEMVGVLDVADAAPDARLGPLGAAITALGVVAAALGGAVAASSSCAKSGVPGIGTAAAPFPVPPADVGKSKALIEASIVMSGIPRPLHTAIARQGRQLVFAPFFKVRAGAVL